MSDYRISSTLSFSAGSGTISVTINTVNVTGVGTFFTQELEAGMIIQVGANYMAVSTITNDTSLSLQKGAPATITGQAYNFAELTLVDTLSTPANPPVSEPVRWAEVRDTGDGLARGLGRQSTTWTWQNIEATLFSNLQNYCSGKSARVYIRTINDQRLGTYRTYQAAMIWPDDEGKYSTSNNMPFKIEFRDLVLI